MRIIAGTFRGRRIRTLRGLDLRPTSDRLRETLFDVLWARVKDCAFLDGYAGSGAVGLEAASRGARRIVFIESDHRAASLIRQNALSLGLGSGWEVRAVPVLRALAQLERAGGKFEICFLDPPYRQTEECRNALTFFGHSLLLQREGVLVIEHSRRFLLPESTGALIRWREIRQGDAVLSFYLRHELAAAADPAASAS
jgi:16S rRNA (guanine(966)-N(2))-methyltransferase RsmD